jgi:hypothetical protein
VNRLTFLERGDLEAAIERAVRTENYGEVRAFVGLDRAAVIDAVNAILEKRGNDTAELEERVAAFQSAAMLEVGGVGDPSLVEPHHVEAMITRERDAADGMAAALEACLPWASTKVAIEDAVAAYRRARGGDAR